MVTIVQIEFIGKEFIIPQHQPNITCLIKVPMTLTGDDGIFIGIGDIRPDITSQRQVNKVTTFSFVETITYILI
jgi:hypothetical protein